MCFNLVTSFFSENLLLSRPRKCANLVQVHVLSVSFKL